jgi:exodeoxyribonuclease VII large subunit
VRGEYQLIVDYIEPKGIGALMAAYEALKERLRVEGLFDEQHKVAIPLFPRKIALITSQTGAVLQDFLRILSERKTPVTTLIYPVSVQGEKAAPEIIRALSEVNRIGIEHQIDLIVLARGGGSLLDLWTFNEEDVARAIFQSAIPIITAIGHETDTTIADFVSDFRAATPSVAAEKIARDVEKQIERFLRLRDTLEATMDEKIKTVREQLLVAIRLLASPKKAISHFDEMLGQKRVRLSQAIIRQKEKTRAQFALLCQRLDLLSPLPILGRGYSIAQKISSGKAIRDIAEVAISEEISVRLHRGELICEVKAKEEKPLDSR